MAARGVDALVIFGATGDLAKLETFPALVGLVQRGVLDVPVVGVAKSGWGLEQFRNYAEASLKLNHRRASRHSNQVQREKNQDHICQFHARQGERGHDSPQHSPAEKQVRRHSGDKPVLRVEKPPGEAEIEPLQSDEARQYPRESNQGGRERSRLRSPQQCNEHCDRDG